MNPIFCAIDTTDIATAKRTIAAVSPHVGGVKLGLEFFTHHGPEGVKRVMPEGLPLFLDLKFYDIPNTVAGAVRALSGINIHMFTLHASGGEAMMKAAVAEARNLPSKPKVLGVTVLTSMDEADMHATGVTGSVAAQVERLATLAQVAGMDGVVCSAHEIVLIRSTLGRHEGSTPEPALSALHGASSRRAPEAFLLVVPGIRPAGSTNGDQKRVMTPKEALGLGASYLVIGRPITEAAAPAAAAKEIVESL